MRNVGFYRYGSLSMSTYDYKVCAYRTVPETVVAMNNYAHRYLVKSYYKALLEGSSTRFFTFDFFRQSNLPGPLVYIPE